MPNNYRESSFLSLGPRGFHRTVYYEWGDPQSSRVVLCVHGLTRNGRDFDPLAQALASEARVICPDIVGRGRSDWLAVKADYGYPLYVSDMATLMARLGAEQVDWVGTSMGGLIGMQLAAMDNSPIRRLFLNDVGPVIPKAALERIIDYVGLDPRFPDRAALEANMREIYAPFGPYTPEQWRGLVDSSVRKTPEGDVGFSYDPGIREPMLSLPRVDVELWPIWDAIRCPVTVLRGEESDLLLEDTAREMARRGPKAKLHVLPGVGHAPSLMSPPQVAWVREFLV